MNMTCKQNYELINLDDYIQSGEGGMALTYNHKDRKTHPYLYVAEQRESVTEAQWQEYATYAWRLERENKPKGFTLSWSQWKGMLRNE